MNRILFLLIIFFAVATSVRAQVQKRSGFGCATKTPTNLPKRDSAAVAQRWQQYRTNVTNATQLTIRLYVVVFADDNGSNRSATDEQVKQRIQNMAEFYAPHDICFVLSGIDHANSTDLNYQNSDTEEGELEPYLREGYLCAFVHKSIVDEEGETWGGKAYDIPNTYLSMDGDVLQDTPDLFAHEVGHCFGLIHTFENVTGEENAARTGDCRDCEGDGDLLCDTPADRDYGDVYINNECEYTGRRGGDCSARQHRRAWPHRAALGGVRRGGGDVRSDRDRSTRHDARGHGVRLDERHHGLQNKYPGTT